MTCLIKSNELSLSLSLRLVVREKNVAIGCCRFERFGCSVNVECTYNINDACIFAKSCFRVDLILSNLFLFFFSFSLLPRARNFKKRKETFPSNSDNEELFNVRIVTFYCIFYNISFGSSHGSTTGSPRKLCDRIFKFGENVWEYRRGSLIVILCDEYSYIRSK